MKSDLLMIHWSHWWLYSYISFICRWPLDHEWYDIIHFIHWSGKFRILHNNELYGLYILCSIVRIVKSRRLWWAGHVARIEKTRNVYRILVEKSLRKYSLWILKRICKKNIKMDLREIGFEDGRWIELVQNHVQLWKGWTFWFYYQRVC